MIVDMMPTWMFACHWTATQRDDLILDDVLMALGVIFDYPEFHVLLGAGDPPDVALIKVEEMRIAPMINDTGGVKSLRQDS